MYSNKLLQTRFAFIQHDPAEDPAITLKAAKNDRFRYCNHDLIFYECLAQKKDSTISTLTFTRTVPLEFRKQTGAHFKEERIDRSDANARQSIAAGCC